MPDNDKPENQKYLFRSAGTWDNFKDYVKHEGRFFLDDECKLFIEAIIETGKKRTVMLPEAEIFYRARIGYEAGIDPYGEEVFREPYAAEEMMAPPVSKSRSGRLNPKGFSYLYLAGDEPTAVAEVRPWMGAIVSAAKFKLNNGIKVIDIRKDALECNEEAILNASDPEEFSLSPDKIEQYVWGAVDASFSEPVSPFDSELEYVPTQLLAEVFQRNGFKGVIYRSALKKDGFNLALFDQEAAGCMEVRLVEVQNVEYRYDVSHKCS